MTHSEVTSRALSKRGSHGRRPSGGLPVESVSLLKKNIESEKRPSDQGLIVELQQTRLLCVRLSSDDGL